MNPLKLQLKHEPMGNFWGFLQHQEVKNIAGAPNGKAADAASPSAIPLLQYAPQISQTIIPSAENYKSPLQYGNKKIHTQLMAKTGNQ